MTVRRETYTVTDYLYLHIHGREEELDAIYSVEVEEYPAEPYSWDGSRGTGTEVTARLICWERHGETYGRDEAVGIEGDAEIIRQEAITADSFDPATATTGDRLGLLSQSKSTARIAAE